ncbi:MAG TPA: GNAT family N-acetyltransferase [Gaiellaceae bacterium]|nr:GNAT family N-acetyltransferase [Gaiellaceae bacterium]
MGVFEAAIREARSEADEAAAATLMAAYLTWAHDRLREEYGVDERPADPSQVAASMGAYRRPSGVLLLADWSGRPVGVGALRRLPDGAAEVKRMYVVPEARSLHIGSRMLDQLIDSAVGLGANVIRLDTCRFMIEAQRLYRSRGFVEGPAYEGTEIPAHLHEYWLFFERRIEAASIDLPTFRASRRRGLGKPP